MTDCIFCKIVKNEVPSYRVYEDEHTIAFFDITPITEYHTLVIPKKHYVNMFDIPQDELLNIMSSVTNVVRIYEQKLGLENVQIVNNSGEHAQQDVFHIHFHVIPRFPKDGKDKKYPRNPALRCKLDDLLENLK